nr:serine/threonine-protein kinase [Deltaproteobacteria bacterium]
PPEGGGRRSATRLLDEGVRLGRYTIVGLLGRGGMGAVYEAEDPELGRRVAIKILHEDRDDAERDALRREAQALATLIHQNVVMVYDVGVDTAGDVFLVMQLVEGETIDAWIARTKPSPAAIIAKFKLAGAGLAAAHAAGLVHCDFKPANVLIDEHGAVRVGDFGLARRSRRITGTAEHGPTMMTTLAGTPAYMAPEQFEGVVTPASDQFAFCIALWECLAGERPFEESTAASLDSSSRGPRRELPSSAKIPRYARRVLERGLSATPSTRFPDMTSLLDALAPKRGFATLIAATVVAAIASGTIVYFATRTETTIPVWQGADLDNRQLLTTMGTEGCAYAPMVEGGTVIFDRTHGEVVDLYSVPLAGGPLRQLTSGPNWEWRAQRGRKPGEISYLLHDRTTEEDSQVVYRDLTTNQETVALRSNVTWDAVTVGDRLFYSPNDNKGIWVVKGEEQKPFATPIPGFTYFGLTASSSGDQLGVTRLETNGGASGAPCTIDVATGALRCIEDLRSPTRPTFGRDSTVLYIAAIDGIYRRDLTTNHTTKLTDDYAEGGLAVAPDGSALIFSLCRTHTKIIDASTLETLVDDPDGHQPSAASTGALAWVRTIGKTQVLMLRLPSGRVTQLTSVEQGSVAYPRFSADGKYLVFALALPRAGLHMIEIDKPGSIRQITKNPSDYYPHWAADNQIAFIQTDEGGSDTLFTVKIDGNDRRELAAASRTLYGTKGNELLVGGVKGVFWLDPATGKERPGPPPDGEPEAGNTSPSGNWVVYQMGSDGHAIYRTRTDGSAPLELVRRFDSSYFVNKPSITDDGQVILSAGPMYGDLVKIPAKPDAWF